MNGYPEVFKIFRLICGALLLSLSAQFSQAADFDHSTWDSLLKKHVVVLRAGQATQVDYKAFAKDRSKLKHYLHNLSQVSRSQFNALSKDEQLAFLINVYNAWTVELILMNMPDVKSIKDLGSFFESPWSKVFIPLFGIDRSLDDVEHRLIRGSDRYNDPRIHFAVNCASIGCPALMPGAYSGGELDDQLELALELFLKDRTRNRLKDGVLEVSSIFKWYGGDFAKGWRGANSLESFFTLYKDVLELDTVAVKKLMAEDLDIDYEDYDWRLNGTPN